MSDGTIRLTMHVICSMVDAKVGRTTQGHTSWGLGRPQVTMSIRVEAAPRDWKSARPRHRPGV